MKPGVALMWRLALSAVAVVAALFAAELYLRVYRPVNYRRPPLPASEDVSTQLLHRRSSFPGLPYELVPNMRKVWEGAMIETNSYGMRDREPLPPRVAPVRIVALGDSFTFGFGVSGEDTYPNVLERLLNARSDLRGQFDVLNLGVAGYASRDEALLLKYRGLQWEPKLVIIGYVLNDPETEPIQPLQAYFQTPEWWQYLHLGRLVVKQMDFHQINRLGAGDYIKYLHAPSSKKWQSVLTAFRDIKEMSTPSATQVLLVIFPLVPAAEQAGKCSWSTYKYGPIHRQVADAATANGFAVLDLYDEFAQRDPCTLAVSDRDAHPNTLAHTITGEAILRKLLAEGPTFFGNRSGGTQAAQPPPMNQR